MKLSARNQLKGKVININKGAVNSIVSIDIGGGNIITATISCAAVEELGLKQPYYVLVWSNNAKYHAAIPISEHEMYLIVDNNIFHAIQKEEYLSEYCLEGL